MALDRRFLDELHTRADIVSVVSNYVQLTKKGGNYFGICPFHNEKTPSFSVNAERQIFHCFGCGAGGDAVKFLMQIEHLEFRDAVTRLAESVGLTVPAEGDDRAARARQRIYDLLRDAARHFHANLMGPDAGPAVEYLRRRRLLPETVTRFGLGYAPDAWDNLVRAMKEKGYSEEEMLSAGLVKRGRSGTSVYDTFRNRLVFPVINTHGAVIGFSGRILGDGEPKYLNSPETPVFNKGANLFALNLAKKSKRGYLLLAEGNIDVVSLHQAGIDCAVASLGTALTEEQVRLLARFTDEVVLCYDSDEAGKKASQRAIELLKAKELKVRVLELPLPPGAKKTDPDEYIQTNGAEAFEELLARSEGQTEYRLRLIRAKHDLHTSEGRVAFLREASEMLARIGDAVEREVFAGRAAEAAEVSREAVLIEVEKLRRANRRRERAETHRRDMDPVRRAQPQERELRYTDAGSALAEETMLSVLLQRPKLIPSALALCPPERFSSPALAEIYRAVAGGETDTSFLAQSLPDGLFALSTKLLLRELPRDEERAIRDCTERILAQDLKKTPAGAEGEDPLLTYRDFKRKK